MPTKYGRSPWIDGFPRSRVPSYPAHRPRATAGPDRFDAVIIGGGLTGCAAAYAFAAAGIRTALLEAGQIGRGASGHSTGWISDDPGVPFPEVEKQHGLRSARQIWQAWRRAALDFGALVRRLDLKCRLEPRQTLIVAATPEQSLALRKAQKARRDAGLEAPLLNARAIGADAGLVAAAGIRTRDAATLDPYRAAVGLAAAAAARGAAIFERSPVRRTTFDRRTATVTSAGGAIRTARVIVATGVPTALFKGLIRHFWFRSAFLALTAPVPARLRAQMGTRRAVIRDAAAPPHVIRWVDDERLLVAGADAETAPDRLRPKTIVQRTGQLMYELSTIYPDISGLMPEYGWEAAYARTADGLPYIGVHRNYPHHLFALGDASHSVTGAYLASRIFLRHHLGQAEPADAALGFNR
jgi:glycine/D-amino acid oxidase-like deaminating enzyme